MMLAEDAAREAAVAAQSEPAKRAQRIGYLKQVRDARKGREGAVCERFEHCFDRPLCGQDDP